MLQGFKLQERLSSKLHFLEQYYAQSVSHIYFDKCLSLEQIERKHINMANTFSHSSLHKLEDLIHLQSCLSYDTWSVTLYVTPRPLSYDPVHRLTLWINKSMDRYSLVMRNSQKFYTVPVYHCQFVFLLGFKFFRFAHLCYILSAPLIRSGKTRTNSA